MLENADWEGEEYLWMEDNLDTVGGMIEKLNSSDLVQDRIVGIISHIVCDDGRI